ncbi:transcriptional regulator [Spirochaetia bacterium]|nr:transcriptional regulator [Spirochaetia bacterium]
MMGMEKLQAAEDFSRARGRAILSQIQHFLNTDKNRLLNFNDIKDILKPRSETYKGMQQVPIKLIVGSEGRYRDFNKYFLPNSEHLRIRWERVDEARLKDIILPPIQLYEIGGVYFVRDGNHRVSVAKTQGVEIIDAEVTSLSSEIPITPSMTTDKLREAVIKFEKELFYEKTRFKELTGSAALDFTLPGQYDVIYNHILVHKYYLNQNIEKEIPFADALVSWYRNVYDPVLRIITDEKLYNQFPGRTPSDLYVWIVKHWDFLKKKYGVHYSVANAARDFSAKYGQARGGFLPRLAVLLDRIFNRK